tara:strand:+ start:208 stop:525 length:318 start_codon:yes stop_codon:yes gene_type:complete
METLNKNWFAVTLLAIVFFLLGFLIGKQSPNHPKMKLHKEMILNKGILNGMNENLDNDFIFISEDGNIIIDTLIHKGNKEVKVRVKKLLSKDNIKKEKLRKKKKD